MKSNTQIFIALFLSTCSAAGTGSPAVTGSAAGTGSAATRQATSVIRVSSGRTAQDIIREAKLKVLAKHYEETLDDVVKLERAEILAQSQKNLEVTQLHARALREYLQSVEKQLEAVVPRVTSSNNTRDTQSGESRLHFERKKQSAHVVAKYMLGVLVDGVTNKAVRKARWEQCLETLRKAVPVIKSGTGDLPEWNLDTVDGVLVVKATRDQQNVIGALIGDMKSKP